LLVIQFPKKFCPILTLLVIQFWFSRLFFKGFLPFFQFAFFEMETPSNRKRKRQTSSAGGLEQEAQGAKPQDSPFYDKL
jgi:hypothetical protein